MRDLNALSLSDLFAELMRPASSWAWLDAAAQEDLGDPPCDVTSEALIPEHHTSSAALVTRRRGVIAGLAALPTLVARWAPRCAIEVTGRDGAVADGARTLVRLTGSTRQILVVERTALNLVGRLSGIATLTADYVRRAREAAPERPPTLCATRKTTPGLRALEKYAVRCGGGALHRLGLGDAVLIKDNHLRAMGAEDDISTIVEPIRRARAARDLRFVELEVDTLAQLGCALTIPAGTLDIILLDNFTPESLTRAVATRDEAGSGVLLEASGGITLDTIGAVAQSGVDRVSVGALTHSAPALDVSLEFLPG